MVSDFFWGIVVGIAIGAWIGVLVMSFITTWQDNKFADKNRDK